MDRQLADLNSLVKNVTANVNDVVSKSPLATGWRVSYRRFGCGTEPTASADGHDHGVTSERHSHKRLPVGLLGNGPSRNSARAD